jgi:dTDP-4-dehydrorhamnose reductase
MMEELNDYGGALIHYSTDYVFDGNKGSAYNEDDHPNPINEYGRSKLGGERSVAAQNGKYLVLRTSWVYAEDAKNFVSSVLRWAVTQDVIRVVDDQVGSPTWAAVLAQATLGILPAKESDWLDFIGAHSGIYHCVNRGAVSRYEFARKILSLVDAGMKGKDPVILPAKTADFPSPAFRPLYSALDCSRFERTFAVSLPDWDQSLYDALQRFKI